jgi:poly-gamma-glutamate capsule biosynthesis protein CapA/YwtB (metallophosphatase superfamily)
MSELRLFLGGDVMTGRGLDQVMRHPGDPTLYESWVRSAAQYVHLAERRSGPIPRMVDPAYVWGDALAVLDDAAVSARIINLETAVTDQGEPWPGKGIHYRMDPGNVDVIGVADIDCSVLANNHVLDWSYPGLTQTLTSLHDAGLATTGAGVDAEEAARPAYIQTGSGRGVVVAALGHSSSGLSGEWAAGPDRPGVAFADSLSESEVKAMARRVSAVAEPGDLAIASIHWGSNWGYHIPRSHQRFARDLIDHADVHVVHGHSSHHPLGIEVYRDRPILYGCGDLINDYEGIHGHERFHPDISVLYLVTMDPDQGRLRRLELVPMRIRRFRLEHVPPEEVSWLADALNREGASLGTRIDEANGRLVVDW